MTADRLQFDQDHEHDQDQESSELTGPLSYQLFRFCEPRRRNRPPMTIPAPNKVTVDGSGTAALKAIASTSFGSTPTFVTTPVAVLIVTKFTATVVAPFCARSLSVPKSTPALLKASAFMAPSDPACGEF